MALDEFGLIRRYFDWPLQRPSSRLGVGDDAALLALSGGQELVISTDTLVDGRHFDGRIRPRDLGWKSLAVNLSDLAAMGAEPLGFTLALTLPRAEPSWLQDFASGLRELALHAKVDLLGGDTTRGPLSISITALGQLPAGRALRRSGARPGESIWVSGPLGDAALALRLGGRAPADLRQRLDRPQPRLQQGRALRGLGTACIDLSDGLTADLGHVLRASGVGARLDWEAIPRSAAFRTHCSAKWEAECLLQGGDDYELLACATDAAAARMQTQGWQRIGQIEAEPGLRLCAADGTVQALAPQGWKHF